MQKEIKNKLLFGLTAPIYIWHIVSGILIHCTNLYLTLHDNAYRIFAGFTTLFMDLELWSALHDIVFFFWCAIFTFFVVRLNKDFSKKQRLAFILMPIVTLVINLIAMALASTIRVPYSLLG